LAVRFRGTRAAILEYDEGVPRAEAVNDRAHAVRKQNTTWAVVEVALLAIADDFEEAAQWDGFRDFSFIGQTA
jgi:hypothetical protein